MKVLITATVQSHICQFHKPLAEVLHAAGYEVHVAARDNLAKKNGLKLDFADKVFDVPFSRSPKSTDNIKAYKQLKKIIDNGGYDIVSCNTPMGGIVTRLAAKKARKNGTKVFYTAHGFHFYKGAPKKNWLIFYSIEKFFARYTDKLITIVNEDYELAKKKFKCPVYHIHGVGVNEDKYLSLTNEQVTEFKKMNQYDDRFLVLCTGELNANKNQKTVVNAISILKNKYPQILLLLAGNGKNEEGLKQQILDLRLENNVQLLGYRTDLEYFTNACDLIVSASFREGLPLNIMEAMLCGKAVVASNNRGHRELVVQNETGFIVESCDSSAFAQKIEQLINDVALRKSFGNFARQKIDNYKVSNVKKELVSIYNINKLEN